MDDQRLHFDARREALYETALRAQAGISEILNNMDGEQAQMRSKPPEEFGIPALHVALIEFKEMLQLKLPERKHYLPWLHEGANVMAFGPRGIGKTMLQLGLTASLVTGTSFLSWKVSEPTGVLYVDGEMQLDELRQRITSLLPKPPRAPLYFLTSQLVYQKLNCDLTLTAGHMREATTQILDAHPGIRTVILDNISCLFTGIDEDRKRDWEPINAWLIQLRHRGLATVLVHHAGKAGQQRGTSGREDMLDVVIQLARPSNYDAREGCHFELTFTKARSIKGEDVTALDVKLQEVDGQLRWQYQTLDESKEHTIRRLFAEGVTSPSEIEAETGITKGYASRVIRKIKDEQKAQQIVS